MKKLFFKLFLLGIIGIWFSGCESEESFEPKSKIGIDNYGQCYSVKEFIQMIENSCTENELAFLNSLPDSTYLYLYSREVRQKLNHKVDLDNIRTILTSPLSITIREESITDSIFSFEYGSTLKTKSVSELRTLVFDVAYMSSNLQGVVSSAIRTTITYEYDTDEHIILSIPIKPICDIVNIGGAIDSYVFRWVDLGSVAIPHNDRISILYGINGNVVLGMSIGNYAVGFICEEIRGRNGMMLVPY